MVRPGSGRAMQGPFRGVAGALARAFGGTVTLHVGRLHQRDVQAILRLEPRRVEVGQVEVETLVPILRLPRSELQNLSERSYIRIEGDYLYRFLFVEETSNPASDALVSVRLEPL